jgi:hypothetical protein
MIQNDQIRQYIRENPHASTRDVAQHFGVSFDRARGIKRRLEDNSTEGQQVETPEGYKGVFTKGKVWQLHDGSWRESLQFEVDWLEKWDKFKEGFLKDLTMLGALSTPVKSKSSKPGEVCLEISLPDAHFGKGDIDTTVTNFINTVFVLLEKAEKFGVDKILLPIGNDGLNSEGKRKTTTGGTPQEDSVDWQESFRHYWTTIAAVVKVLSDKYPVDVMIVPGNHDMERMFYIGEVLGAFFRSNNNVKVNNSGDYRKYYQYGVNMLMFTHGDKEKTATLPLIMATEQPEMFAQTKFREAHLGHFHKEMLNEYCGVKTRFLPSICPTDDWHKMMGYSHLRAAQAYIWNKEYGLEGYFQVNIHEKQEAKH